MSALIGALRATLGLDSAAFEKGASAAEKRAKKLERTIAGYGKSMTDLGKNLSIAVSAPLVALGVASVSAALESKAAIGQVETALKTMGEAAGRSSTQLQALAGKQMRASLFDDDEILRKVTANLLTFGNVAGNQFDRAQQAALDLSARLGQDLQSSAIQVGKALNDPIKGVTALQRVGVSFTAQQKVQIKTMVEAGRVAEAQQLILAELEKQYGGSAEAARKANPFAEVKKQFGEFQEQVGDQLLKALPPITAAITKMLEAFNALSPGMQQAVVIGGLLAAAFGPLLVAFGTVVTAVAPLAAAIGTIFAGGGLLVAAKAALVGLAAAFGPVLVPLAAFAAAGALIYANWDKIAPALGEFRKAFTEAVGPEAQELVSQISALLSELWNGPLGQGLRAAGSALVDFQIAYGRALGPAFIKLIELAVGTFANLVGAIGNGVRAISRLFAGDLTGAAEALLRLMNAVFGGIPGIVLRMVEAVRDYLVNRLGGVWTSVTEKIETVKRSFRDLYDAVVGNSYVPDMVDGIALQMRRLDAVMVEPVEKAANAVQKRFRDLAEQVRPLLDRLFPEAAEQRRFDDESDALGQAGTAGVIDPSTAAEAQRRLWRERMGLPMEPSGATAIEQTAEELETLEPAMEKVEAGLGRLGQRARVTTVAIAQSFKDMATETLSALRGVADAIKGGGFLDILTSVIGLGLQLGSLGAFGKGVAGRINAPQTPPYVPGYAGGTGFARGGLALVGERGPELVDLPRGSRVWPNGTGPRGGGQEIRVVPSPYFEVVVDGRVVRAAPAIMDGAATVGQRRAARAQSRRLA